VAGPPCGGKTTYVKTHAGPGEPILDWDEVYAELAGPGPRVPMVGWDGLRARVEGVYRDRWEGMSRGWVIRCAPHKQHRSLMRKQKGARSIVLATPATECIRRLLLDDTRPDKQAWIKEIGRWWAEYQPSSSDQETVIRAW
jgi:hypothetical protein